MRLQGKIAIITGGASGIGAAIAERFAAEGAETIAADLACTGEGFSSQVSSGVHRHKLDVSEPGSVERLVDAVLSRFQRIDVLVNCAGIGANKPFLDTPLELFDRILAINLRGVFLMSQAAARRMTTSGGSIINIGSISGLRGNFGRAAYGASQGGVVTLSEGIAGGLGKPHNPAEGLAPGSVPATPPGGPA